MRAIWTGAISFGLIYIPVRLFSASSEQDLDFDMLRRGDLCRIRYVRVCEETGEEVPWADIVKGYEYRKGEYVVVTDEDFARASPKKSKTIEIVSFVRQAEIDTKLLEKPYYLEPVKGAERAYALLRGSLQKTEKVGLARFVLRTREAMAMLKSEGDVITLNRMRWASEIRATDELELPGNEGVKKNELQMAIRLVDQLTETFDPAQYTDTYTEQLLALIKDKAEGKEREPEPEEPVPAEVTDLFAKLRQSLEAAQSRR